MITCCGIPSCACSPLKHPGATLATKYPFLRAAAEWLFAGRPSNLVGIHLSASRIIQSAHICQRLSETHGRGPLLQIVFAVPRAITEGRKFGRNIVWKHSDCLQRTDIIAAKCTGIDLNAHTVTLDNGQTLEYDFLVLCTGVTYSTFKGDGAAHTVEARLEQYDKEAEK